MSIGVQSDQERIEAALDALLDSEAVELPILPAVVGRVLALCGDPDCESRALAELVRGDQSLMASLLRAANGAIGGARVPIVSLQLAISRLGLAKVREIVLTAACKASLFAAPGHEPEMRLLFRHAVCVAQIAQEIARVKRQNVEEAYTAGLLHDVGRPALLVILLRVSKDTGVSAASDALLGLSARRHEEIGSKMIASFGLPERIALAVRHHHDPREAGAAQPLARVVRLADLLAKSLLGEAGGIADEAVPAHEDCLALNLYPDDVTAILARRESVLQAVEALA